MQKRSHIGLRGRARAALGLVALCCAGLMQAMAAPSLIDYQGKLLNASGNPVTGTVSIVFSVHTLSTGGSQVWIETNSTVSVREGLFHVLLGSINALPAAAFAGDERWLQLRVNGETLTPRTRVAGVPYAHQAENAATADYATTAGSAPADTDWTVSGANIYRASGSVGIGIAGPSDLLHVYKASGSLAPKFEANAGDVDMILDASSGNPSVEFRENGSYGGAVGYDINNNYVFLYQGSALVWKGGKLGIGTNAPAENLDVAGSVKVGANGTAFLEIRELTGTCEAASDLTGVAFPTGYTADNTRIVYAAARSNASTWDFIGHLGVEVEIDIPNNCIWLSYDSIHRSQPYRIGVMKIK